MENYSRPQGAPNNLGMNNLISHLNAVGGTARPYRFAVKITPRTRGTGTNRLTSLPYIRGGSRGLEGLIYACDSVEFPGRGFNVSNIRYYGPSQVVPNNVEYGPCNISLICSNSSIERQFFDDWQDIINPTNTFHFRYPDEYYCDIEIFQFSDIARGSIRPSQTNRGTTTFESITQLTEPKVIYNWKLHKAWPTFVSPQQVAWSDNADVLRLQVTFAYKYWDRPDNLGSLYTTTLQNNIDIEPQIPGLDENAGSI